MMAFSGIFWSVNYVKKNGLLVVVDTSLTRNNHWTGFLKKVVLKNFAKFIGTQLCQILFFNNVASSSPATLLKKRLRYKCFAVNFLRNFQELLLPRTSAKDCFCLTGCFRKICRPKNSKTVDDIFPANIYLFQVSQQ